MQHQLGGFCLLLVLLGLLVLVDYSHQHVSEHYWQSRRVQSELRHTLQQAQHALREAAAQLASDKSFLKNVTWQLPHSVQQSINAVGAEHWQVAVWGKKCALLYGTPHPTAQTMCATLRRGQARAFTQAEPLQLAHLHAFPHAAGAVLLTLPLQEKWLAQQPQLASLRARLPATRLAWQDTGGMQVRFVYQQAYRNHLLTHHQRYQQLLFWARLLLYTALVAMCIVLYGRARRRSHAVQRDLQHLVAWSEQPTASELAQVKVEHALVQRILLNFGRTLQAQLHHLNSVKKQIAVKNKLLARLSKDRHRLQHTQAQQALTRSVIEQAAQCNAHFVAHNLAVRDNAQDLRAAIFAVHRQQLKPLLQISNRWQQEFQHRHVADFLGAYYNAEQENFLLRLEKDLRHLATLAEETYSTLTHTLSFTRQLSHHTRSMLVPLQFWGQVLTEHSTAQKVNLSAALCQAQELTQKIHSSQRIKFSNRFDADYHLQAAAPMLVAAFYHLCEVFLPETQASVEIVSHITMKNQQLFITINTTCAQTDKHSATKQFHLAQARLILQKYQIEVLLSWLNGSLVVSTSPLPPPTKSNYF